MAVPAAPDIILTTCTSIEAVPREDWQRLAGCTNPFLRYEFFQARGASGCTRSESDWTPSHLMFRLNGEIRRVAPAYLKRHSMTEVVLDSRWADASQY